MQNACNTHLAYLLYPHLCDAFILSQSSPEVGCRKCCSGVATSDFCVLCNCDFCGLCGNRQNQVYRAGQFGVEVDKWFGRWNSDDGN